MLCALVVLAAVAVAPVAAAQSGRITPRIVQPTGTGTQVPYQVAVHAGSGAFRCGGTLRDARHVVTAAHCLRAGDEAGSLRVRAGSVDRDAGGVVADVAAVSSFPGYDGHAGDAALLRLATPVAEEPGVIAYLAPVAAGDDEGAQGIVSGWGAQQEAGEPVDELAHARIDLLGADRCAGYEAAFAAATMLCAGVVDDLAEGEAAVDACRGDSGGPLARATSADGLAVDALVGIVAFGTGCGRPEFPGVYTRVAEPQINAYLTQAAAGQRPVPAGDGPGLDGTRRAGEPLTCSPGAWRHDTARSYRWERGRLSGGDWTGEPIPGETGAVYVPAPEAAGETVACFERAANAWGAQERGVATTLGASQPPQEPVVAAPNATVASLSAGGEQAEWRPRLLGRSCTRRGCTVRFAVRGVVGFADLRVAATLERARGCRRGAACRARILRVRRAAAGRYVVSTGRLGRGRWRVTLIAADTAGGGPARRAVATVSRRR